MGNGTYSIDDGFGNQITAGLASHEARRLAQEIADARRESVWLYQTGSGDGSEEIAPTVPREWLVVSRKPAGICERVEARTSTDAIVAAAARRAGVTWDYAKVYDPQWGEPRI